MTGVVFLSGSKFETQVSLEDLYVLYKQVFEGRAHVVVQMFQESVEKGVDIRKLDPEKTFIDGVFSSFQSELSKRV